MKALLSRCGGGAAVSSERTKERLKRYPKDWKEIVGRVKARAKNQCECEGECGLHPQKRCEEINGQPAKWAKGKIVLTTAHLDHTPETRDEAKLKAMCQRCHLRYDMGMHMQHSYETRRKPKAHGDLFA